MVTAKKRIGIVGARGHTGAELIRLVAAHPALELAYVSSRELDGQRVDAHVSEYRGDLRYSAGVAERQGIGLRRGIRQGRQGPGHR
jgi:N-acetyl-gamma-glutamyl-phosphate reductase